MPQSTWRAGALAFLCALAPLPALPGEITVFAAASLQRALGEIGLAWGAATGHSVVFSFAGSSALARQIQMGAPADLFIPASVDWMDAVADTGEIDIATRRDILSGSLVLVAHGAGVAPMAIDASLPLADMLGGGRLAMALVDAVPAGIYGRQALVSLGLWDGVQGQLVQAENVTGALNFVAAGAAGFGIVYASDAKGAADISVIGTFPASSHDPITYPAAVTRSSAAPMLAVQFLDFLTSDSARAIWQKAGFTVLQ